MHKLRTAGLGLAILVLLVAAGVYWLAPAKPIRIGIIPFTSVNERVVEGFKSVLEAQGFQEGSQVEYRTFPMDGDIKALDGRVADLVGWPADFILAASTPPSQAAYRGTRESKTPMVFAPVTDPVAAKIVLNLARPGENATGVRLEPSNSLRLEWLKRIAPASTSYYVPYSKNDKSALASLDQIGSVSERLGIKLLLQPVESLEDIQRAARQIPPEADAIFLPQDSRIESEIMLFVDAARQHRLPLSAPSVLQVEQGALMAFGFDHRKIGEQAGRIAIQILRGARPGDLPVETAENGLYINQAAAQAIGLQIEENVLRQADRIFR